jgi:PhnB protein
MLLIQLDQNAPVFNFITLKILSTMANKTALYPYLTFNGNCRDAMEFYQDSLGGSLDISNFGDAPMETAEADKARVMHARLQVENIVLMASDSMPGQPTTWGVENISLSVDCTSKEQVDQLSANIARGGAVTMPVELTFWGAYFGMVTDKFGIQWMFNYDVPKS